ncbi:MAG: DNA alkylation repair protein [Dermatophilaceae bacterium]
MPPPAPPATANPGPAPPAPANPGPARRDLVEAIRTALARNADPDRAPAQQRYMRSALPYLGLTAPLLRQALRPILADPAYRIETREPWEATVRALWDEATHREHWYAALALAKHRSSRGFRGSASMPLYRHLVETGAWWDVVDDIATHLVREALGLDPARLGALLREWAREPGLWVRRTAILSQVGAKTATDTDLLAAVIAPSIGDPDFFARKAIGWALRDYARTDPDWVTGYVAAHPDLSPLSRKEALKHLGSWAAASPAGANPGEPGRRASGSGAASPPAAGSSARRRRAPADSPTVDP